MNALSAFAPFLALAAQSQPPRVPRFEDMRVRAFDVQVIGVPSEPDTSGTTFVPMLLADRPITLALEPYTLLASDFRLLVQTTEGFEEVPYRSATFRGTVLEVPGSSVAATLSGGSVWARVVLPGEEDEELWIQPLRDFGRTPDPSAHVVYRTRDVLPGPETCGVAGGASSAPDEGPSERLGVACMAVTQLAFDSDREFYLLHGSDANALSNDILNVMNMVDSIYAPQVGIAYSVTTILVRAIEPDPYASFDSGCSGPGILDELQSEWNANFGGLKRDIAHLMTGKDLTGITIGCAYVGVVCSSGSGYGVSQSRFTTNMQERVTLTAHELGHNWSAQHCDGDPSGCHIMCSAIGGCSGNLTTFAPVSVTSIVNHRNSRTCLSNELHVTTTATAPWYGTWNNPFLTIGSAANCAPATGSRLLIGAGTYAEAPLTIDDEVVLAAPVGLVRIQ